MQIIDWDSKNASGLHNMEVSIVWCSNQCYSIEINLGPRESICFAQVSAISKVQTNAFH